jgi:hypothetical protein
MRFPHLELYRILQFCEFGVRTSNFAYRCSYTYYYTYVISSSFCLVMGYFCREKTHNIQ